MKSGTKILFHIVMVTATIIAGIGCGLWDAKEAGELCAVETVMEPIPEHFEIYRAIAAKYKRLCGSIKSAD